MPMSAGTPHFMALPLEIRSMIFEYIFASSPGELAHSHFEPKYVSDRLRPLLTCHIFHDEAHRIAYRNVVFYITLQDHIPRKTVMQEMFPDVPRIVLTLNLRLGANIRSLAIGDHRFFRVDVARYDYLAKLAESMPNLERLLLEVSYGDFYFLLKASMFGEKIKLIALSFVHTNNNSTSRAIDSWSDVKQSLHRFESDMSCSSVSKRCIITIHETANSVVLCYGAHIADIRAAEGTPRNDPKLYRCRHVIYAPQRYMAKALGESPEKSCAI